MDAINTLIDFICNTQQAVDIATNPTIRPELSEWSECMERWWNLHDRLAAHSQELADAVEGRDTPEARRWKRDFLVDLQHIKGIGFYQSARQRTPHTMRAFIADFGNGVPVRFRDALDRITNDRLPQVRAVAGTEATSRPVVVTIPDAAGWSGVESKTLRKWIAAAGGKIIPKGKTKGLRTNADCVTVADVRKALSTPERKDQLGNFNEDLAKHPAEQQIGE
jgi:hypothetical protein